MCHSASVRRSTTAMLAGCSIVVASMFAQTEPRPYTLHVYVSLIEVPVLALDSNLGSLPSLDPKTFVLSLDGGPPFAPTRGRVEGDDPLLLGIVVDRSQHESVLAGGFGRAFASLAPGSLKPADRVEAFAFNCAFVSASPLLPPNAKLLQTAFEHVPAKAPDDAAARCDHGRSLLGALSYASTLMAKAPGRKALLVVSDADVGANSHRWSELRDYDDSQSIAVFALRSQSGRPQPEEPINLTCRLTGGMVLPSENRPLAVVLAHFVQLLRGRYILDFPRPALLFAGEYRLDVTLPRRHAFIRAAGVSMPLPSDEELASPVHALQDTSKDPQIGPHRILPAPQ